MKRETNSNRPAVSPAAEEALSRYLARLDARGTPTFDEYCAEHPALAPEMRRLVAYWESYEVFPDTGPASAAGAHDAPSNPPSQRVADLLRRLRRRVDGADRYQVKDELARGGMGRVMRVHDDELERELAMKVIRGVRADDDLASPRSRRMLARFVEEAQVTGQLDHPGIVPIHDLGIDERGRLYFTMRLIRGRDLATVLERRGDGGAGEWNETRVVSILQRASEAVAYAHEKGVIHRDLKPSNIMIGRFGEVYVMDWGLARVLDEPDPGDVDASGADRSNAERPVRTLRRDDSASHGSPVDATLEGHVLGTPAYMPPEQARGERDLVGPRSDVYSMGAILYRVLAGHSPHGEGSTTPTTAEHDRSHHHPPRPVASVNPSAPPELVSICEKAMATDPRRRYATMIELSHDLRAYLEGRVVQAHAHGAAAELKKWVRRNLGFATALGAAVAIAIASAFALAHQASTNARALDAEVRRARSMFDFVVHRVLSAAAPTNENDLDADVRVRDVLIGLYDVVETHFPDDDSARAELHQVIGAALFRLGENDVAERHVARSTELARRCLGEHHPTTFAVMIRLAQIHLASGRVAEAEALYEHVADRAARHLGPDSSVALDSLAGLGFVRGSRGDLCESKAILEHVLDVHREQRGDRHPQTADAMQRLATCYRQQGRYDLAEPLLRDALEIQADLLGEDSLTGLMLQGDLAAVLAKIGRFDDAEQLFTHALERLRRRLGDDHQSVVTTEINYGVMLLGIGRLDEAERIYDHLAERFDRGVRAYHEHPFTVRANQLAVYASQERLDRAAAHGEEARPDFLRVLGPLHPTTIFLNRELGNVYLRQGRNAMAIERLREAYDASLETWGDEHAETWGVMLALAQAYRVEGCFGDSEPILFRALAAAGRRYGAHSAQEAIVLTHLALLRRDQELLPAAEALLLRAEATAKRRFPAGAYWPTEIRRRLALLRSAR